MSIEQKFNIDIWYILQKIKKGAMYRPTYDKPIPYPIYFNVIDVGNMSKDDEWTILEKLDAWKVIDLKNPSDTSKPDKKIFYIEMIQPKFNRLYNLIKNAAKKEIAPEYLYKMIQETGHPISSDDKFTIEIWELSKESNDKNKRTLKSLSIRNISNPAIIYDLSLENRKKIRRLIEIIQNQIELKSTDRNIQTFYIAADILEREQYTNRQEVISFIEKIDETADTSFIKAYYYDWSKNDLDGKVYFPGMPIEKSTLDIKHNLIITIESLETLQLIKGKIDTFESILLKKQNEKETAVISFPNNDTERLRNFLEILKEEDALKFFDNLLRHLTFKPQWYFDAFINSYLPFATKPTSQFFNEKVETEFVKFNAITEKFIHFLKKDFFEVFKNDHKGSDEYVTIYESEIDKLNESWDEKKKIYTYSGKKVVDWYLKLMDFLQLSKELKNQYLHFLKVALKNNESINEKKSISNSAQNIFFSTVDLIFPEVVRWEKVTIKMKDGLHDIEIFYDNKHIRTVDYIELGFFSGKKQKKPNRQWNFLCVLSVLSGTDITKATANNMANMIENRPGHTVNKAAVHKIKETLVKHLCFLFKTNDNPFHDQIREYYSPKFTLLPETTLRQEETWESDGKYNDNHLYGDDEDNKDEAL